MPQALIDNLGLRIKTEKNTKLLSKTLNNFFMREWELRGYDLL